MASCCCHIWSIWIVWCFVHLFVVLAGVEYGAILIQGVLECHQLLHPCVHAMIHHLFLLLSLIPVLSCWCLLSLVAVQAWGDCWHHEGFWWTWYSCTNWSFPWRHKVHGDPRWTWCCHPRKEGTVGNRFSVILIADKLWWLFLYTYVKFSFTKNKLNSYN